MSAKRRDHGGAAVPCRIAVVIIYCLAMVVAGPARPATANEVQNAYTAYQQGDYAKARQLWQPLAQAGDVSAQYALGQLYLQGLGIDPDPAEAVAWFEKAAREGHRDAMFNLAATNWTGNGMPTNRSAAVQWWRRAAALNDAASQYNLGLALYNGIGVKRELLQAAFWLREAANNHYPNATALYRHLADQHPEIVQPDDAAAPLDGAAQPASQSPPVSPQPLSTPAVADSNVVPDRPAAPGSGRIGTAWAPVFAERNVDAAVLEQLPPGTPIRILSVSPDWSKVEVPGGLVVWVYRDYVVIDGSVGQITAAKVNARPLPSTRAAPPVGRLVRGDHVAVLTVQNRWVKVRAPTSLPAWVLTLNIRGAPDDLNWQHDWAAAASRSPDPGTAR